MLTRPEFDTAVRDALRRYARTDLLVGNALLRSSLMTQSGPSAATPEALKALLTQTAEALFANGRDRRLYRVLELTYFNPAPKQDAAAERLGVSFSTYRRHLAEGIDRLTEWLWQQEQKLQGPETGPRMTADPRPDDGSAEPMQASRPRLSIVILPFLNLSSDPSADYLVAARSRSDKSARNLVFATCWKAAS